MGSKTNVKPITYLKNHTADLVREVSEEGRTVMITQNGEAKVMVMNVETYDRWRDALALLKMLAQSEAAVAAGEVVSQKDAFKRAQVALKEATRGG
jgi:prevent-host-death family protein